MTNNRRAKHDARARMAATGESYTAALRRTRQEEQPVTPAHLEAVAAAVEHLASNPAPAIPTTQRGVEVAARRFQDDDCANCMKLLPEGVEGLFCTELCKQTAETVRYWRGVLCDGRIARLDVREALSVRLAHLLAGGYARDARHLSPGTRDQVWERDDGRCCACSEPGEEIDHIDGDSPDLSNLQLLCTACHHAKTQSQMVPASVEQGLAIKQLERERVVPDEPTLLCDDRDQWKNVYRRLKKERRQRLLDELEENGYDLSSFRGASREEMCDALRDSNDDYEALGIDDDSGYGPDSYFARAMAKDD